jgi:cystathionine beta-lyase
MAIVQNPALRKMLTTTHTGLVDGANVMGYQAALSAYRDGDPWLREVLAYLEANVDFLQDFVERYLPGITMARPEGTYLAWLDCRGSAAAPEPGAFFLERARVAVNEGALFGRGGEGFVRLNFACPRATLEAALARMRDALARVGG